MTKAILYNDLFDFYDHDDAETRCFYLPIEKEELEPYLVDYEPVIHAKWRIYDTTIDSYQTRLECSYCQYDFTFENLELDTIKFCPHCGAKMDEEVQDNGEMGKS